MHIYITEQQTDKEVNRVYTQLFLKFFVASIKLNHLLGFFFFLLTDIFVASQ